MARVSKPHAIITGNVFALLRNHLRGSGCMPYMTDMKFLIEATNFYSNPDVADICDEDDRNTNKNLIRYRRLIVEFLLPKTAVFDIGNKFADCRTYQSLQE